ncbi:MAG TPA: PilZ domain-containing protein [Terriglobales bacterium]|nr:PilZ domain-containing protein [Terriglobales bacterium]
MTMRLPNPHLARIESRSINRSAIAKRRSNRIALKAPVGLSGEDRLKCAFTMTVKATNLNKHGATIQITRDLSVGSTVLVRNNRGSQLSARIVAQTSAVDGLRSYGIEFLEQDESSHSFWGIVFPSA